MRSPAGKASCELMGGRIHAVVLAQRGRAQLANGMGVKARTASGTYVRRRQVYGRLAVVLAWPRPELHMDQTSRVGFVMSDPPGISDALLRASRALVARESVEFARRQLTHRPLRLTRLGVSLASAGVLWPHEAALTSLLRRSEGLDAEDALSIVGETPRTIRSLFALFSLGAVGPVSFHDSRFGMLVRKQRAIQRRAPAWELLGVPKGSSRQDVRRAVRRLAASIHPDRFMTATPHEVSVVSEEVFRKVLEAAAAVDAKASL